METNRSSKTKVWRGGVDILLHEICCIEFPKGCRTYNGPYSATCLNNIWKEAGCVAEGFDHPGNLTKKQHTIIDNLILG